MLAEPRLEDFPAPPEAAPDIAGDAPDAGEEDGGAAALRDLIAAGLVSHEAIGDPGRLPQGEPAALRALCRHVAGPVYRIAPFHYAFAADPAGDAALAADLAADLGPEALWTGALAQPEPAGAEAPAAALPEAALLLLRAREAATAEGIAVAAPGLQAVIDARYAAAGARLAAAGALGGGAPWSEVEARLAAMEARLEERIAEVAAGLAAARLGALAGFEERLGLALAEFLARIERHEARLEAVHDARPEAPYDARPESGRPWSGR